MRTLRSRLTVFALAVVACQSASMVAAPLVLCGAFHEEKTLSGADVDCPCGDETGMCPMHHRGRPAPQAPSRDKAYCSGCSDASDAAFLIMTGPTAPAVTPFVLFTLQPETAAAIVTASTIAAVDRPPSSPPPRA